MNKFELLYSEKREYAMNADFDFEKQPGLKRKNCKSSFVMPFMSVITPFYNAGKYFEQTFNCVVNQTFEWFEWIIVDDGSTNESDINLLQKLAKTDCRIKIYHIENAGPAAARNYAVSKSNTNIILPLDADDLIEAVYLEETYFGLYFHPDATWAYADSVGFGGLKYVWKVPFDAEKLKKKNFLINIGAIRKDKFWQVGGYDDAQRYSHEDWNLWLRLMAQGGYPVHIDSVLAWYRISNTGALHETNDNKDVKKRAYERVREEAKMVSNIVEAIEYPRRFKEEKNRKIECSQWNQIKEKKSTEILLLIPSLDEVGKYKMLADECKKLDVHIGIMATEMCVSVQKQNFLDITDDVFELCSFLDIDAYPEFISYYIKSRQVDAVFTHDNEYGRMVLPWLRSKFPYVLLKEIEELELNDTVKRITERKIEVSEKSMLKHAEENSILDEYADKYIQAYTDKVIYENMYSSFNESIKKYYAKEKKRKIRNARFLDTKFGSLMNEILGLKKA